MNWETIQEVTHHKHLGVFFYSDLRWSFYKNYITKKAYKRISVIRKLKIVRDRLSLEQNIMSSIRPLLEYRNVNFDNCTTNKKETTEKVQYEVARIVSDATKRVSIAKLMSEIGWECIESRLNNTNLLFFIK
jgi:hypothetical protein